MNKNLFAILVITASFISCTNLDLENPDATEEGWNKNPSTAVELSEDQPLSSSVEQASSTLEASSGSAPSSVVVSSSVKASSASGEFSLWNRNSPFGQVQVPCTETSSDPSVECQGWWYGSTKGTGSNLSPDLDANSLLRLYDPTDGDVVSGGHLTANGIKIALTAGPGFDIDPSFAMIGFNFVAAFSEISIESYSGLCLTYKLTGNPMELHLYWNGDVYGEDTWHANLAVSSNPKTVRLAWGGLNAEFGNYSGSFEKSGWANGVQMQPIATAVRKIRGLKFESINTTAVVKTSNLEIYALGKGTECQ